jgi:hypothetical protein
MVSEKKPINLKSLLLAVGITMALLAFVIFYEYTGWMLGVGFIGCLVFATYMVIEEQRAKK